MITRPIILIVLAAASGTAAPAFAGGFRLPSFNDREIVLVGGMGGGAGGMGGHAGGMGGAAGGMPGGGVMGGGNFGAMGGGNFGGSQSGGPMTEFGPVDRGFSEGGTASTYHYPQRITLGTRHTNIRTLAGHTTAQLNRQELTRIRSPAETPRNPIFGFFNSLFH